DRDFFPGVCGERDADSVADAFGQQHTDADGATDRTRARCARFGDAEMQGVRHQFRQPPVSLDHRGHVEGFHADLDVVVVHFVEDVDLPHSCVDHALYHARRTFAFFEFADRRQRTTVDADADRNASFLRFLDYGLDLFRVA